MYLRKTFCNFYFYLSRLNVNSQLYSSIKPKTFACGHAIKQMDGKRWKIQWE